MNNDELLDIIVRRFGGHKVLKVLKCEGCKKKFEHYTTIRSGKKRFCPECLAERGNQQTKDRYHAKVEKK